MKSNGMNFDFGDHAYRIWVGSTTALSLVLGVIVWKFVPIGPWMMWLVLCGLYLGCIAAFIDIHFIQGR
jgi:hypothetical protein